jgi:hypothetical protein
MKKPPLWANSVEIFKLPSEAGEILTKALGYPVDDGFLLKIEDTCNAHIAHNTPLPSAAWVLQRLRSIQELVHALVFELERLERRGPFFTVKVIIENETIKAGPANPTTEDLAGELTFWRDALDRATYAAEHESSGGRGRAKSRSTLFISELSTLFTQHTGIRAGRGGSRAGPATGPFVRFVAAVNTLLPSHAQIPSSSIPKHVARALATKRV